MIVLSEIAKKAWKTRKGKERAEKAVRTRKRRKFPRYRNQLMLGVKDLLMEWSKKVEGKDICGDGVPKTILQEHHFNPFDKSEGKTWLCASCHNIFNKATKTTELSEVIRDLKLRRKRFDYNIKQSF